MKSQYYNLIFVYTSFRRHNNIINFIKGLGDSFKIGIFLPEHHSKWNDTEETYLQYCLSAGASMVEGNANCDSFILSRLPKEGPLHEKVMALSKEITYRRVFVNVDSPLAGFTDLDKITKIFGKPILLVPSVKDFGTLEPDTLETAKTLNLEMVETGSVYQRYSCFTDFETDYMVAYPSHTTINSYWEHYRLLRNIIQVIRKLPKMDKIVVKPHNVRPEGNKLSTSRIANGKLKFIYDLILKKRTKDIIVQRLDKILCTIFLAEIQWKNKSIYQFLPRKIIKLIIALQNEYIFKRCENLLERYPPFGIEQFIHGIKKGLITGISLSVIEAAMQSKLICRCDDLSFKNKPLPYNYIIKILNLHKCNTFVKCSLNNYNYSKGKVNISNLFFDETYYG